MRRFLLAPVLLSALVLTPACAAAVVGAAAVSTVQYVRNEAYRDYSATLDATWSATLEAMRDLAYPVDPSVPYGENGGTLRVNDVHVRVQRAQNERTRVRLRIGTFDTPEHRVRAKSILDGIARRLGLES
ncbi:MAG: DUF3568 family protein [Planctomycetota bacterium]|nr:DUF3568 family protein [Planctomycetota bacterium]